MDCLVKSHRIPGVKRAIYCLIPLLMILSVAGTAWSYELRVNCGGDAFTGATGHLFYADQPYSGNQWGYVSGYNLFHWVPIRGSPDSILYRTARLNEWPFSYKFNLPNDSYDITLRFNELKYHWYGMSAFSVQAENVDIITDFSNDFL